MLRGIPAKHRVRIMHVLKKIFVGDFSGIDRKKLAGYENIYRVRIGNYRIIYFDDDDRVILKAIRKRDESTYRNL